MFTSTRKVRKLEKEINKILAKVYTNKTYACVDRLQIDLTLEMVIISIRVGVYDKENKEVDLQTEIDVSMLSKLYSLKQIAALCVEKSLDKIE